MKGRSVIPRLFATLIFLALLIPIAVVIPYHSASTVIAAVTPPVITCPADVTIECDESSSPSNTGIPTATDGCSTPTITWSDVMYLDGCNGTGYIERTWTATDDCGTSVSCVQIITVVDTTPSVITCPADVTIECDESSSPSNTGIPTATDSCGTPTITWSDVMYLDGFNGTGYIERTWTATDDCGNSASCVQIITVVDTTLPVESDLELLPPTIDGDFSPGEWTNPQLLIDSPIPTNVYFSNDNAFLYVCVDAANAAGGDYSQDPGDYCDLFFDTGHDEASTPGHEDWFRIWGDGTKEHVVTSAIPAFWEYHCDFGAHPGLEGAVGFGESPNSGTDHRIYEYKIPLGLLGASPGDTIGFSSPTGEPLWPNSLPHDYSRDPDTSHNVWPPGAMYDDMGTWGDLVLARTPPPTPTPSPVPTISQWGMVGMAIVLAAALVWSIRRRWLVSTGKS